MIANVKNANALLVMTPEEKKPAKVAGINFDH